MNTVDLSSWLDFEAAVRDLERRRRELESKTSRSLGVPLFRGLGSSNWGLETTLERSYPLEASEETISLYEYYTDVYASKSVVETFTERQWEGLPDTPLDFSQLLADFATLGAQLFFSKHIDVYRYFVYLRHHGFASPLLDWTASPYIAAFFAFDSMPEDAEYVSIYAMSRDSLRVTSSGTNITILGPYVRSHRGHLLQQSQYSICLEWYPDHRFRPHGGAMEIAGAPGIAGELSKLNIPARATGLRH